MIANAYDWESLPEMTCKSHQIPGRAGGGAKVHLLKPLWRKHNDHRGSEIFLEEMSSERGPRVH